jgi:hypothetical protein
VASTNVDCKITEVRFDDFDIVTAVYGHFTTEANIALKGFGEIRSIDLKELIVE